jgi:hypothetical protein
MVGVTLRAAAVGWLLLTINAVGLALASARYFRLNPVVFLPAQVPVYLAHRCPLLLHTAAASPPPRPDPDIDRDPRSSSPSRPAEEDPHPG